MDLEKALYWKLSSGLMPLYATMSVKPAIHTAVFTTS
jgi:hypothetical protein